MLITLSVSSTSSRSARPIFSHARAPPCPVFSSSVRSSSRAKDIEAVLVPAQLEQRPAVLVERLVVESRAVRSARYHGGIGLLRVTVAPGGKQHLAATELHLGDPAALRIARDDRVECRQRLRGLARGLVAARELVEHLVVALVVGIGLEQRRIQADRLGARDVDLRHLGAHALELAGFQAQVAQTPQRLGAQLRIGVLQLQELAVILHRLAGAARHLRVPAHLDLLAAEIADGRSVPARPGRGRERSSAGSGQRGQQHPGGRATRAHCGASVVSGAAASPSGCGRASLGAAGGVAARS